jgi:hypothetical protein
MASIAKDGNGLKRVLFFNANGERKTIRLGKASMHDARTVATRVELLVSAKVNGTTIESDTISWLTSIGDRLYAKLVKHGLVSPRVKSETVTLGAFLDAYIAKRKDVKAGTVIVYGHSRRCLVDYFGADKPLNEITPADAKDWRRWLGLPKNEKEPEKG